MFSYKGLICRLHLEKDQGVIFEWNVFFIIDFDMKNISPPHVSMHVTEGLCNMSRVNEIFKER